MGEPARKPAPQAAPGAVPGPQIRTLKKGELLFGEGENSRSMYFIKNGMIRIFKKKGNSQIEIDTIHSGQILGELAFLDGQPRSASGEALVNCQLVEINAETFSQTMKVVPDWLKLLLKTVVGRLRTASTRIRQLESASTSYDYSSKDGKRTSHYVYLSTYDILKICSAILLVGARTEKKTEEGHTEIRITTLQKYANQIMGVPVAKITSVIDALAQNGVMSSDDGSGSAPTILKEPNLLERFISYCNEENLKEPSKRHDVSIKGFLIMSLMAKHLSNYQADPKTGLTQVNLAEISEKEKKDAGKEPFRMDEFPEISKMGFATEMNIKATDEVTTNVKAEEFMQVFKFIRISKSFELINEQKGAGHKK